jgi:hypothetical protein
MAAVWTDGSPWNTIILCLYVLVSRRVELFVAAEDNESDENGKDDSGSDNKKSGAPKWLLTVSVGVNVVLAAVSGYTAFVKSDLEAQKKTLEQQLLVQENSPAVSMFYVLADVANLRSFLDSKDPLPFVQDVTRYRIYQNQGFDRLSSDLAELRKGRSRNATITFLVIANSSKVAAHSAALQSSDGSNSDLGEVEAHGAILIPTAYKALKPDLELALPQYAKFRYEARIGQTARLNEREIPKPGNPSWTPAIGSLKGWARAAPEADDSYLRDLVPPKTDQ